MQIVIDIPEYYYKAIKEIPVEQSTADMMIIRKGTPLPEIHGDLVDKDDVLLALRDYVKGKKTIGHCIDDTTVLVKAKVPQEGVE